MDDKKSPSIPAPTFSYLRRGILKSDNKTNTPGKRVAFNTKSSFNFDSESSDASVSFDTDKLHHFLGIPVVTLINQCINFDSMTWRIFLASVFSNLTLFCYFASARVSQKCSILYIITPYLI